MNQHILIKCLPLLLLSNIFTQPLLAQVLMQDPTIQVEPITDSRAAVPITTRPPRFPMNAAAQNKEGSVMVSFIIDEEGKPYNMMIEDSVGGAIFEKASIKAISSFVFEPAIHNGEPISQSMTRYIFNFRLEDMQGGARRKFLNDYTKIIALIETNDEDIDDQINNLLVVLKAKNVNNLYEYAWYGWLEFRFLNKYEPNNSAAIVRSLQTATMVNGNNRSDKLRMFKTGSRIATNSSIQDIYIDPSIFIVASKMLFIEHLKNNNYSSALRDYDTFINTPQLKALPQYEETLTTLSPLYNRVIEQIDGDNTFLQTGLIGSNSYWVNELLRPSFSIENVEGSLSTIDIRCSGRTVEYSFIVDQVWTLPASWGLCSLYLKGGEGTSFDFYSIP